MKKAIIYARQSFWQEEGSVSIEVQLESCRKWAKEHGVNVVGEYSDADTSSELYPQCQSGIEASKIDRGYQKWLKEQRTKGRKQYSRKLMKCALLCDTNDTLKGIYHYQLHFYEETPEVYGDKCQYEDENISVWIY